MNLAFSIKVYSLLERVCLRDAWLCFLALLVLIGLFFFPRLSLGLGASVRLEDIAGLFIIFSVIVKLLMRKIAFAPWMLLTLIYFTYIFLVSIIRYVVGESTFDFVIFFGKEFQYFCFALAFYYLISEGHDRFVWRSALLLSVLVAFWGGWQLLIGHISYYGISAPFLSASPSLAGQVYWFCSIIVLSFLLLHKVSPLKTNMLYFIAALNILSCVATISRSAGFGLLTFLIVFFVGRYFVLAKKRIRVNDLLVRVLFVVVGMVSLLYLVLDASDIFSKLSRYGDLAGSIQSRFDENWSVRLQLLQNPLDVIAGLGYGVAHMKDGVMTFGMAYDSQYMRNILVLGVVGSLLWFVMLILFGWYLRVNKKALLIYFALVASFLVSGVGFEVFNLSKSGAFFWLVTGILFGIIHSEKMRLEGDEGNVLEGKH